MVTPVKYFGSKAKLSIEMLKIIPKHKTYVEVFGGSAALLFAKNPSEHEVYNDLNDNLVTLFRVLRDDDLSKQLYNKLNLTLYSRTDFKSAQDMINNKRYKTDVEHAWATFVSYNQATNGKGPSRKPGWAHGKEFDVNVFYSRVELIDKMHDRLKNVQVECEDWKKVLATYDSEDTFFYMDPPYVMNTRVGGKAYEVEFEYERFEHKQIIAYASDAKGMVFLSGYNNSIYNELLNRGWGKVQYEQQITADVKGNKEDRTEVIWYKPGNLLEEKKSTQLSFFDVQE